MRNLVKAAVVAAVVLLGGASEAFAWHLGGYVRCDANLNGVVDDGDLPLAGVTITVRGTNVVFEATGASGADGKFQVKVLDKPASYTITIEVGGTIISPLPHPYPTQTTDAVPVPDYPTFLVDGAFCTQQAGACWLTGGGAKFSEILGLLAAEKGPQHSFGGNVNPSCSPESGDGGNWNHVAHDLRLHFQGKAIRVIRCGNVPDEIPPGSTSPVTPYNFIEFEGVGTLTGIKGSRADYGVVTFRARAEDRNEPGSSGNTDGTLIDRYFLEVRDGGGTVRLLVDNGAGAPVAITHGNLQLHISSCTQ